MRSACPNGAEEYSPASVPIRVHPWFMRFASFRRRQLQFPAAMAQQVQQHRARVVGGGEEHAAAAHHGRGDVRRVVVDLVVHPQDAAGRHVQAQRVAVGEEDGLPRAADGGQHGGGVRRGVLFLGDPPSGFQLLGTAIVVAALSALARYTRAH